MKACNDENCQNQNVNKDQLKNENLSKINSRYFNLGFVSFILSKQVKDYSENVFNEIELCEKKGKKNNKIVALGGSRTLDRLVTGMMRLPVTLRMH